MDLRIHDFLPHSRANGPGIRAVVWVQGCALGCPGCFNPLTHPHTDGELVDVAALAERIEALAGIEGITLSGGEPLQQAPAVLALLRILRPRYSLVLFTGYTLAEVARKPWADELLALVDVLIAGRYDGRTRIARDLRGSASKTLHFLTPRYTPADFTGLAEAEVFIAPDGTIALTGIAPLQMGVPVSPIPF